MVEKSKVVSKVVGFSWCGTVDISQNFPDQL